jgi:hypothetical protein
MDRTTVLWDGVLEADDGPRHTANENGWQAFLGSWKMGAILALACVVGLIAIFSANPFASASVSERVSDTLGQLATCTAVGASATAEMHSMIYRCAVVGMDRQRSSRCFAVSGADIRQFGGRRGLGC